MYDISSDIAAQQIATNRKWSQTGAKHQQTQVAQTEGIGNRRQEDAEGRKEISRNPCLPAISR